MVPIVGGGMGVLACLLSPNGYLIKYAWVPLILDPSIVFFIIYLLIRWFFEKPYTPNDVAADKIIRFVEGKELNEWEWDDFTTGPQSNPDVNLAIRCCLHYAYIYPSEDRKMFCDQKGIDYYIPIAEALKRNLFHGITLDDLIPIMDGDITPGGFIAELRKVQRPEPKRSEEKC